MNDARTIRLQVVLITFIAVACSAASLPSAAAADNPRLLRDVNTLPIDRASLCGQPVVVGARAFFCGGNNELWVSDGTEAGTKSLSSSSPSELTSSGAWLYFLRSGDLWRTDGTVVQTVLDSAGQIRNPELMTDVDGELYFFRLLRNTSSVLLHELWKTDGSVAGTVRVKRFDVRLNPNDTAAIGGKLFFTNYDHQLWVSDGSAAGTVLLKDINGFNINDDHNNLTDVDGTLFFSLEKSDDGGDEGRDLWASDGTPAGTRLVAANVAAPFRSVANFQDVQGSLYFTAQANVGDTEIWVSDGTTAGTRAITTLRAVERPSGVASGALYFVGSDRLWRTDGTEAGTVQLATNVARFTPPTARDGLLYFSAENDSGLGTELWSTDGTVGGTMLVRDLHFGERSSGPIFLTAIDTGLLFEANRSNKFGGRTLWITTGSRSSTRLVKDISQFSYGSIPSLFTALGNRLFFLANGTQMGVRNQLWSLWQTDGSRTGTTEVIDVIPERTTSSAFFGNEYGSLIAFDNLMYFTARDAMGWALWRTDGSTGGTQRLNALVPSVLNQAPLGLTVVNNRLYFFAPAANGVGLWQLAPGASSASLLTDGLTTPASPFAVSGKLVFADRGDELWQSDGTAAGTRRIKALQLDNDAEIDQVQAFGDSFIFTARWDFRVEGRVNRTALWISDGTEAGTVPLTAPFEAQSTRPSQLVITGGRILFATSAGLFASDGTAAGTSLLEALSNVRDLTLVGTTLYFSVDDRMLWRSDGTFAGTQRVANNLFITAMGVLNGELYFGAYVTFGGGSYETTALRKSDGTAGGTVVVKEGLDLVRVLDAPTGDLFVGRPTTSAVSRSLIHQIWQTDGTDSGTKPLSALPNNLVVQPPVRATSIIRPSVPLRVNNTLFFSVDDGEHGLEPWVFDLPDTSNATIELGDFVWWDSNGDGRQDENEPGLAGIPIELEDCDGNSLGTTTSDSDGHYRFDTLAPGRYRLRFTAPDGYEFSPREAAGDYLLDSNADPDDGLIYCRTVKAGQRRQALDVGFVQARTDP